MKCPHCLRELKYVERPGRRCSRCHRDIALEPRENTLQLSDLRLQGICNWLSREGQYYFTIEQLRLRFTKSTYHIGIYVITFILILMLGSFGFMVNSAFDNRVPLIIIIVMIVFLYYFGPHHLTRILGPRWMWYDYKMLKADSIEWIEDEMLRSWQNVYSAPPTGLLTRKMQRASFPTQPTETDLQIVIACPRQAILDCLRANGVVENLGVGLLPIYTVESEYESNQALLLYLQKNPKLPLLLLHDASLKGALYHLHIRMDLGLQPQHSIIDLGLHPQQVFTHNLIMFHDYSLQEEAKQLKEQINQWQFTAFKAGEPPRENGLTPGGIHWLKAGYYSPILGITPTRLLKIVTSAVQRYSTMQQITPGADLPTAETVAQRIGFMSWPEPTQ